MSASFPKGVFTISFDCEGLWGPSHLNDDFRRRFTTEALTTAYRQILEVLQRHEINATFAFVGAFCLSRGEVQQRLDWFEAARGGRWPRSAEFLETFSAGRSAGWICPQLVEMVRNSGTHELATHGFQHLAIGDHSLTQADFERELALAAEVGRLRGFTPQTLIYPRNQVGFTESLAASGILGYREYIGQKRLPLPLPENLQSKWDAAAALLREVHLWQQPQSLTDHARVAKANRSHEPVAIPAGYFLNWRVGLRRRIPLSISTTRWRRMLQTAATDGGMVHVWSHPHNFITGERELELFENIVREAAPYVRSGQIENLTQLEVAQRVTRPVVLTLPSRAHVASSLTSHNSASCHAESTQQADEPRRSVMNGHNSYSPIRALSVVYNFFVGGHENRLLTFARSMARDDFDYRVLSVTVEETGSRAPGSSMRPPYVPLGIPVDDLGEISDTDPNPVRFKRLFASAGTVWRIIRKLVAYLREHNVEVIDAHHTTAMFAAIIAGRITGVPVILSSYHVRNWGGAAMWLPGQVALGAAAAIITDSQDRAGEIRNWLQRKSVPIHVVPTGISYPHPERSADEVWSLLKLPADRTMKVIGCVAGLIPTKGQMVLLEAAIEILKQQPQLLFVCIGYSRQYVEFEQQLRERIAAEGLADRFFLRQYPHAIGDVWQVIDLFVHPSMFDSLPLAVIEAMATAKPIVATRIGGIPEVIEHERTGLLVPPNDPAAIAAAVLRLLNEPKLASQLGRAAQGRHQAELTPEVMARKLEAIYRQVLGRPVDREHETPLRRAS